MLNLLKNQIYLRIAVGTAGIGVFGIFVFKYTSNYVDATSFHRLDPDPSLRKVEKDVIIAKYMRDKARTIDCQVSVEKFNACCREPERGSLKSLMTFSTCKQQSIEMFDCMNKKFTDPDFYYECKDLYLKDKHLFKKTNVDKQKREMIKISIVDGEELDMEKVPFVQLYYDHVLKHYNKTNDIDSFDESLTNIA